MKEVLDCLKGIEYEGRAISIVTTVNEVTVPFIVIYNYEVDREVDYADDEILLLEDSYLINIFTKGNARELIKEIKQRLKNKFGIYISSINHSKDVDNEDGYSIYANRLRFKITKKEDD